MKKRTRLAWAGLLLAAVIAFGTGMAAAPKTLAADTAVDASLAVPSGRYTGVAKIAASIHKTTALSNSDVAGRIPKGDVAVITKRVNSDLYQVTYQDSTGKDISGYINASFLEENTDLVYAISDVNLRSSNSTSSKKITTIPKNATVEVVMRNEKKWGKWIKVNYKGKTGFAHTDYVKTDEEIKEDEKKKAEEELKKLKEEIANTIDCADIEFENITVAYDGKYHKMPRVTNLPDGVEVSYTGATKYKTVGVYLVKATFKAESKGKKLANASPRIAYLRIAVEKGYTFTSKGIKYEVTKANEHGYGTVMVKGTTNKKVKALKIPEAVKIGGVRFMVTEVDKKAFKTLQNLKTVTIGNKVSTIGTAAFWDCPELTSVRLGADVKKIGEKAFYKTPKLKTINIVSQSLEKVGKNAFGKTAANAIVWVPGVKLDEYTKLLAGKGLAKTAQIK